MWVGGCTKDVHCMTCADIQSMWRHHLYCWYLYVVAIIRVVKSIYHFGREYKFFRITYSTLYVIWKSFFFFFVGLSLFMVNT